MIDRNRQDRGMAVDDILAEIQQKKTVSSTDLPPSGSPDSSDSLDCANVQDASDTQELLEAPEPPVNALRSRRFMRPVLPVMALDEMIETDEDIPPDTRWFAEPSPHKESEAVGTDAINDTDAETEDGDDDMKIAAESGSEEEDVKVYVPRTQESNVPAAHINSPSAPVKVVDSAKRIPVREVTGELEQLNLDYILDAPPAPLEYEDISSYSESGESFCEPQSEQEEVDPDAHIDHHRRKRAEEFKPLFKLSGDEEPGDPDEMPSALVPEREIEDFQQYEDADAIRGELEYRRRTGWLSCVLSGAGALLLILIFIGAQVLRSAALSPGVFVGVSIFILALCMVINGKIITEGFSALLRLRANAETGPAAAAAVAMLHAVIQLTDLASVPQTGGSVFAAAGALSLFLCCWGRQLREMRVERNFRFVSHTGEKYSACIVDDEQSAREIGRAAVAVGEPSVGYYRRAGFLTRFLEISYDDGKSTALLHRYVPLSLAFALILTLICGITQGFSAWRGLLSVFTAAIAFGTPSGAALAVNAPFLRAAGRLLRRGGMLTGWQAVADFGGVHALAIDSLDLFPDETVMLHGIKTFSGARIDESILDAAAVSIMAGGPLSSVFRRVIENRTDLLGEVDTLVYEQDMGMSGWVGGRRVLIGNRRLLQNHGVDVPSGDYEARYAKDGRRIVYLSTAGELCAMFVVSYVADEGIADSLVRMTKSGVTLLVRTCDPNVTEEMISETYDIDPYYVEVMNAPAGRRFDAIVKSGDCGDRDAVLASNGRLEGSAAGLAFCRRLRSAAQLACILQVLGGLAGLLVCSFIVLFSASMPSPLLLAGYTIVVTLLSVVLPLTRGV